MLGVLKKLLMGIFISPKFPSFLIFFLSFLFFSPKRHFFGMEQSLVCKKMSTAHHSRREWSKNWEMAGLWGAWVYCLFGFHVPHFILFSPLLSKQVSQLRGNLFKNFLLIPLLFSLCYFLALPSLRENSDTPTMYYKQMLGNGGALLSKVHCLGQCPAPWVF